MGLEEASGLKEARKERNSISWAVYEVEKREKAATGARKGCRRSEKGPP